MKRDRNGRFTSGASGNPSGRPKRSDAEKQVISDMCTLTPAALQVVKEILEGEKIPVQVRLRAAEVVFERVCGKPMTGLEIDRYEDIQSINELFGL